MSYAGLDAAYALLPKIDCQKKCSQSCGPIVMSRLEWIRIIERLGFEPKGNVDGIIGNNMDGIVATWNCPMLSPDRLCNVYDIRPLICRLWGVVKAMKCPWGCVPEFWLEDPLESKIEAMVDEAGA